MKTSAILVLAVLAISGACARDLQQTFTSGGTCTAIANSRVTKVAQNGFKDAVALAYKEGCSAESPYALVEKNVEYFKTCAVAIVKVWTSAFATCTTWGKNSWGCASSFAYAKAQSKAYIQLTSSALAVAVNTCPDCDPIAVASNFATLLVELFAKAEAISKASVCVGPRQTASAYAWSECNAQVIAHGLAYAFAKATISGGCTSLTAEAITVVNNYVTADPYCKCKGYAWVCLNGSCKYTYDQGAYIDGAVAKNFPQVWAFFEAECAAYAYEPWY